MGSCLSSSTPEARRDKEIQELAEREWDGQRQKIKVLLLGTGESGKSTLFKQLRKLYSEKGSDRQFSKEEVASFENAIFSNIHTGLISVIDKTEERIKTLPEDIRRFQSDLKTWEKTRGFQTTDLDPLRQVWENEEIQATWIIKAQLKLQVQDNIQYFLEPQNLSRLCSKGYEPSFEDILHTRIKTAGLATQEVELDGTKFEVHDVGGQRNERRKWIHHFDDVTTVLFMAALSEYDQVLYEDFNVPRVQESLSVFHSVLHESTFKSTPFLLFLNKEDLFREKLKKTPFKPANSTQEWLADYNGVVLDVYDKTYEDEDEEFEKGYNDALKYMMGLFEKQRGDEGNQDIYTHVTTSTNSENIKVIMESAKEVIVRKVLDMHFQINI